MEKPIDYEVIRLICPHCIRRIGLKIVSTTEPFYPVVIVCVCGGGIIHDAPDAIFRQINERDLAVIRKRDPKEFALIIAAMSGAVA